MKVGNSITHVLQITSINIGCESWAISKQEKKNPLGPPRYVSIQKIAENYLDSQNE